MTDQSSKGDNIENIQWYDNEKYDSICDTILFYNKIYIQNYQNELNMIPNDLDIQIDNIFIELQNSKENKKKFNKDYVRNRLIKKYKDNIKNKYNYDWNISLSKYLNIKPITIISNNDYINFYNENKIILIPLYLDDDKNTYYFCSYRCMKKTNYNLISLLKKTKR